jgi:tRNA (guanine37-N1)-methyltransferase
VLPARVAPFFVVKKIKMRFDIITIFPDIFEGFLKESIIKRAIKKGLIFVKIHNLRQWAKDSHQTVDAKPFGGGRGMVMKVEPIYLAVNSILKKTKVKRNKIKIILLTPRGEKFNQKKAWQFSKKLKQIIMICGRYEGVDERVAQYLADLKLSIGDYVLMGGEVAAMVLIEAISRLIPGVVGKSELLLEERVMKEKGGFLEYPQYTRPAVFIANKKIQKNKTQVWKVPKVLLSGNHKKIEEWRKKHSQIIAN